MRKILSVVLMLIFLCGCGVSEENDSFSQAEEELIAFDSENCITVTYQVQHEDAEEMVSSVAEKLDKRVRSMGMEPNLSIDGNCIFVSVTKQEGATEVLARIQESASFRLTDEDKNVYVTGDMIERITLDEAGDGTARVRAYLDDDGTDKLFEVTNQAYTKSETVCIYYSGHLMSQPNVTEPIRSGELVIAETDYEEARIMKAFLEIGELPAEIEEVPRMD